MRTRNPDPGQRIRFGVRLGAWLILGCWLAAPALAQFGPLSGDFAVNTYITGNQTFAQVGSDGGSGFVVVWASNGSAQGDASEGSIQAQIYSSAGAPVGSQFQVNTYITTNQRYPAIAPDGASGFVVVWDTALASGDNSQRSIQGQRYTAAGAPKGNQFQINTFTPNDQRQPAVGPAGGGNFVVIWTTSNGGSGTDTSLESVQGQVFTSAGAALGPQFQVNTYTTNSQGSGSVSSDGGSGFVVTWSSYGSAETDTSSNSIQAQVFNSAGVALGPQFQVNTYTTNAQFGPRVSPDGGGGFVVTWFGNGSASAMDNDQSSVQAQRYTSTGTRLGEQFQVNTYTTSNQVQSSVSLDGTGGFVVVWRTFGSTGSDDFNFSIAGQRYLSTGAPNGTEFQVNAVDSDQQIFPSVGLSQAGGFVVAWTGYPSGPSPDSNIVARQFGPLPTATSTVTFTPTSTPSATPTFTTTNTPTQTFTTTSTPTQTFTRTSTPTQTFTRTSTATFTGTATSTETPTVTETLTETATPTLTDTPTPTATETPSATGTITLTPTKTPLPPGSELGPRLLGPLVQGQTTIPFDNAFPVGSRVRLFSFTGGAFIAPEVISDGNGAGTFQAQRELVSLEELAGLNVDQSQTGIHRFVEALASATATPTISTLGSGPGWGGGPLALLLLLLLGLALVHRGRRRTGRPG